MKYISHTRYWLPKHKSDGYDHYSLEDSATEPFLPHWRSNKNKQSNAQWHAQQWQQDPWRINPKGKNEVNLEPMRNNTTKFLIRTWLLPSSRACSNSSQLRLRLWTTSGTSDWSQQLAIPGVWPSVSTPVDTSSFPDSRSKFGITCKNEDNKPLPQKQIHNVN